jgi:hypothetical protein
MGCDSEMAKNPSGVKEGKIQESNDRLDGNRGEILLGKLQMQEELPKTSRVKAERERESSITQRRDFAALPPNSHEQPNTRRRIFATSPPAFLGLYYKRRAGAVGMCLQFKLV